MIDYTKAARSDVRHEIRRRQFVRWRDWGVFLLALGLVAAVAIY